MQGRMSPFPVAALCAGMQKRGTPLGMRGSRYVMGQLAKACCKTLGLSPRLNVNRARWLHFKWVKWDTLAPDFWFLGFVVAHA